MSKMFEFIYAYIYKNHYLKKDEETTVPQDRLYNISDGDENDVTAFAGKMLSCVSNIGLGCIDGQYGVDATEDNGVNFDLDCYIYYPQLDENLNAISRIAMRKASEIVWDRGSNEFAHVRVFDVIPSSCYVVDMMATQYFTKTIDENENPTSVSDICEIPVKEPIKALNIDSVGLKKLTVGDLGALEGETVIKNLAVLVDALLKAKSNDKNLYLVYSPSDFEKIKKYITILLKLFPTEVANQLSFITAYGKTDRIKVDICGVPTISSKRIESLKESGCVVQYDLNAMKRIDDIEGEKGVFASLLETMDKEGFENWLDAYSQYEKCIKNVFDINSVAELYLNRQGKKFDENDPQKSFEEVMDCIDVVTVNFDKIVGIDYELKLQIDGIKERLGALCGNINEYSLDAIVKIALPKIIALYAKCEKLEKFKEQADVFEMLMLLVFGTSQTRDKCFEIFAESNEILKNEQCNVYDKILARLETQWENDYKNFFADFAKEQKYREKSTKLFLSLVAYLAKDFNKTLKSYPNLFDGVVKHYTQQNPTKLDKLWTLLFERGDCFDSKLKRLIKAINENVDEETRNNSIRGLCSYLQKLNCLEKAVKSYPKQKDEVLGLFLDKYLSINSANLKDIYSSFAKAEALIKDYSTASFRVFVYGRFVSAVLNEHYKEALSKISFEDISQDDAENYKRLIKVVETLGAEKPEEAINAINQKLEEYDTYATQTRVAEDILNKRIEFVKREALLLSSKAIYKLLKNYVGESNLIADIRAYNKNLGDEEKIKAKPYKSELFLEFAEKEIELYLKNKLGGRKYMNQDKFCNAVSQQRKLNSMDNLARGREFLTNMITASVLAVVMAIISIAVGVSICKAMTGGYFVNVYYILSIIVLGITFCIYWLNIGLIRRNKIIARTVWQSILSVLATVGVYSLVQYILMIVG